jgi:hypothetical protein
VFAVIEQEKWQDIIEKIEYAMKLPSYRIISTRQPIKCPVCQKDCLDYGKLVVTTDLDRKPLAGNMLGFPKRRAVH